MKHPTLNLTDPQHVSSCDVSKVINHINQLKFEPTTNTKNISITIADDYKQLDVQQSTSCSSSPNHQITSWQTGTNSLSSQDVQMRKS